jgi:ubiquinone/menaquinone biosynthesis C-methylase UbiE
MSTTTGRTYSLEDDETWDAMMRNRTAIKEAAFMLPFLKKGQSIVDIGCGQGTITVDLAELVAPGIVAGFDPQAEHIQRARSLAQSRGLSCIFEVGDVYKPPFAPSSFDIGLAHMVFMHLQDPESALRSVLGLLKPGGLICTRDRGSSYHFEGGNREAMSRVIDIVVATTNAASGSQYGMAVGEVLNRLCREAGLEVLQVTASLNVQRPSERTYPLEGPFGQRAIDSGVSTRSEVDDLAREWDAWAADPDAYMALDHYEVVARKPA